MNAWHSFAIALVLSMVGGLFFLVVVRELLGARWARILEAMRGLIFWSVPWVILTAYAYLLQATTLGKLTRSELVGMGEPWFAFIHQTIQMTTPYVMAGILTFLAAAGGFLVATHLDMLLALIGLVSQGTKMSPEEQAGLIPNLISSLIFILAGMVMIWVDARVFSLRWALDIAELETELQGVPMIARLICWGYFLGFILLSWILHRKYRQFLDAINMDEDEGREAPRRETPQQLPPTREETIAPEIRRRRTPSSDNGEGQRIPVPQEPMVEFPVLPEQLPSDGNNEEAVLPEHLDPFQTRRW
jgi:uncharacterized membrane protein (DUF485 family)